MRPRAAYQIMVAGALRLTAPGQADSCIGGTDMAEVTSSSELPSSALCDRVGVLTEEGLELESRVLAFAAEACELAWDFDGEVGPHLHGPALDRAAVRCGLGVLHALVERMVEALAGPLGGACDAEEAA